MATRTENFGMDLVSQGLRLLGGAPGQMLANILDRSGLTPGQQEGALATAEDPIAAKRRFLHFLTRLQGGVALVVGRRGTGKTSFCMFLGEFLGRPVKVVGVPQELLPDTWEAVTPEDVNRGLSDCVVIVDDSSLFFNAYDHGTQVSQGAHDLVDITRHRNVLMIFNVQRTASLDRYIFADPDVIFMKPPSMMYLDGERDDMKRKQERAAAAFQAMDMSEWVEWVYVYSDMFMGMMKVPMASFWTEALSVNKRNLHFDAPKAKAPVGGGGGGKFKKKQKEVF